MKLRTFLTFTSLLLAFFGVSMLLSPEFMAQGFGLGSEINNLSRVLFRDLGTDVLVIAMINWLARDFQGKPLRVVVMANLFMQTMGIIVNTYATTQGYFTSASSAMFGIIMHVVLAAGFAYFYFKPEKS